MSDPKNILVPSSLGGALSYYQHIPRIARPGLAATFIPVVGPAWEAAADLQEGKYLSAAMNAGLAVADVLPIGAIGKGVKAVKALHEAKASVEALKAARGYGKASKAPGGIFEGGLETAKDMSQYLRVAGIKKPGKKRITLSPSQKACPNG